MNVFGSPIACAVCYCDTCQQGGRALEALPNALPVREPDGGTAYVLYRSDRVGYPEGAELLEPLKIDATATSRVYATCCNTAMLMRFDDARHWVCVYRSRFHDAAPAVEFRICTKYKPVGVDLANDVPAYAMYPPTLLLRLVKSRLAMLFAPRAAAVGP
ncbi:MAG TPA: hypothetical protein VHS78_20230 [Candidatus Elarobacter sp.]|jgi:hypothetical protein|nr:hypothetical protein [Candidatus Elarobacter sp.]